MSNQDSFIDEVSEEVRRDKLFGYLRRYGWIGVVVVLLLVGGTIFTEWRKSQTEAAAQAAGDGLLAALRLDDDAARADALAALSLDGNAAAVAGLIEAANLQEVGDVAGAAAALDAVAANAELPQVYRDLAALKSVLVQQDTLSADDQRARLSDLAAPGGTFRLIAQEQLAYLTVQDGDREAALDAFEAIALDAEATRGLRERAISMIVALDGDPEALINALATQGLTGQ